MYDRSTVAEMKETEERRNTHRNKIERVRLIEWVVVDSSIYRACIYVYIYIIIKKEAANRKETETK